jgi:signal peptidase II
MDRRLKIYALLLALLLIATDQSTKGWALTTLRQAGGHLPLPGPVDLTLNFNQSNAFSLTPVVGHATRWILLTANLGVAAVLLCVIVTRSLRPPMLFGLALIVAGAVGNGLDRLSVGAVVDFLDASKIGFPWIFNVADATLDGGIVLVILGSFANEPRSTTSRASADR